MNYIQRFLKSDVGKGSLILFILINIYNVINYLFHFSMARLLSPGNYAIIASMSSLIYIYTAPVEAIQGILSNYSTQFSSELGKIKNLWKKSTKKGLMYSISIFILLFPFCFFLSNYLNIPFWALVLTNFTFVLIVLVSINRGILQGKKRFYGLGISLITESLIKLVFACALVLIGFSYFGALTGILIGLLLGFIFSFYFLKDILISKEEESKTPNIKEYSFSFTGAMIVVVLMYSLDILLAKRFFSPEIAGKFAVLSMLGKMIFFGTIPISKAMFPICSERYYKKQKTKTVFIKSFLGIATLGILASTCFLIIPSLIIKILFGNQYLDVADSLFYVGMAYSFLALSNNVLFYGLSINKFKKPYYLSIFLIMQMVLLYLFNSTIMQFSLALMSSNAIMFLCLLLLILFKRK